jgi:serine-type D-Ala-D-Ala carboxypeptidase/endopeptidase (penicillin-binding protein 4)
MRNLFRCATLALSSFFIIAGGHAQDTQRLQSDLDSLFHDPKLASAGIGVCVQSLKTGEYLYHLNEKKSLLPASNMKLFSAAEALALLGPEWRYKTNLVYSRKYHDLIIAGCGDPSFGTDSIPNRVFYPWIDTIKKRKLSIERVFASDSYFHQGEFRPDFYSNQDKYPMGWSQDDLIYYYAPSVHSISFNENQITVTISTVDSNGPIGYASPTTLLVYPDTNYVKIQNRVETKGAGDTAKVWFERDENGFIIDGLISRHAKPLVQALSVDDARSFAITEFCSKLKAHNIHCKNDFWTTEDAFEYGTDPEGQIIATNQSQSLVDLVRHMNKESDNLYAECLFRTVAKEKGGEGSWTRGIEVMRKYLASIGIDTMPLQFTDGSGLSRMDLVTTDAIVKLLTAMWNDPKLKEPFYNSLPIAGVDGTFKNHLKGTSAEGNARGKSGSMTGVRALSGYLTTKDGEPVAYSIILNNYTESGSEVGKIEDAAVLRLVNFSRK